MNERLQELRVKAGLWASDQHPFTSPEWTELRDEKFAELVWRAAYEQGHDVGVDAGFEAGYNASFTEQHFGVE